MTMKAGIECYNTDVSPVIARGVRYNDGELNEALGSSVGKILWDETGTADLNAILSSVVTTEFSEVSIRRILSSRRTPENWRVGEGMAEAFLVEHRRCEFPWPSGWDLKNPNSSPAGTDLVGFHKFNGTTENYRFAFGEVKTSEQEKWPPTVIDGRHGLKKQLEGLKSRVNIKDNLVKYLGHHAQGSGWLSRYKSAAERYLVSPSDVSLFGILVRDVDPDLKDLSSEASNLALGCPAGTSIELRAMYFPKKTISTFAQRASEIKERQNGNN